MAELNWFQIQDQGSFDRLCNRLLFWHVSRAVTTYEGPGADEGVDAEFHGSFGELSGYWLFQRKFVDPRTQPSAARAEIRRQLLGTAKKRGEFEKAASRGADVFVVLANVELTPQDVRNLNAEREKRGYTFVFQSWHQSVLTAALARYPFLTPTPHPVFLPVEERFGQAPGPDGDRIEAATAHGTPLRGREEALARFDAFVAAPEQSMLVVHGSGGVGKTRYLKECAVRLAARQSEWHQRFVRTQAEALENHLDELLPDERYVLLLDDAQDFGPLDGLLELFGLPAWQGRLKLVVATRTPHASALQERLPVRDPRDIATEQLSPLEATAREEVLADLAVGDSDDRRALVVATRGEPTFLLVEGARLLARGESLGALGAGELVRRALRRYLGDVTGADQRLEDVVTALAAISPVRQEVGGLREHLAEVVGMAPDDVARHLSILTERGAVDDRAGYYRVVPPLFGEYALAARCLDRQGRPTGYHERLLRALFPIAPKQLLTRLAEIELPRNGGPSRTLVTELVEDATARIEDLGSAGRLAWLEWLEGLIPYCPGEAAAFVRAAATAPAGDETVTHPWLGTRTFTNAHVLRELPKYLKWLARHRDTLEDVIEAARTLALVEPQPGYVNGAMPMEVLEETCSYVHRRDFFVRDGRFYFSDQHLRGTLEHLVAWSRSDDPRAQALCARTLHHLFARNRMSIEATGNGNSFQINHHEIPLMDPVLRLRLDALGVLTTLAESPSVSVRRVALEQLASIGWQLGTAEHGGDAGLEPEWDAVRDCLSSVIGSERDWEALNAVGHALSSLQEHGREVAALRSVLDAHPGYRLFELLIGEHKDWDLVNDATFRQLAAEIPAAWSPAECDELLSEMLEIKPGWRLGPLIATLRELARSEHEYAERLVAVMAERESTAFSHGDALLAELYRRAPEVFRPLLRTLASRGPIAQRVAAATYGSLVREGHALDDADAATIELLLSVEDTTVRAEAAAALPALVGRPDDPVWRQARQLAATGDAWVIDALAKTLFELGPAYRRENVGELIRVLDELVSAPRLGGRGYYLQLLIADVARYEPEWLIRFLRARYARKRDLDDGDHTYLVEPDNLHEALKGVGQHPEYRRVLASTFDWLLDRPLPIFQVPPLLAQMEGVRHGEPPTDRACPSATFSSALLEWTGTDRRRLELGAHALRSFPKTADLFALMQAILARAGGDAAVEEALSATIQSTGAVWMGASGTAPPYLLQRIELLRPWLADDQPAAVREFARRQIATAERGIAAKLEEDAVEEEDARV